jgi:hypothetical protein
MSIKEDKLRWIKEGIKENAIEILVVSDDFSHEYYPVFIFDITKKTETIVQYNQNMQRVKESINISQYCVEHNIDINKENNKILSDIFIERMEIELIDNSNKGVWTKWKPTKEEWLWEMQHHMAKLQISIQNNDKEGIQEYSADVANLAEKSYMTFGS